MLIIDTVIFLAESESKFGMIHGLSLLSGVAFGFGMSQFVIQLSRKIETVVQNFAKNIPKTSATWIGWFVALAVYGFLAVGGVSIPSFKGTTGFKSYISYFVAGWGIGGIVDEVINMPDITTIGKK